MKTITISTAARKAIYLGGMCSLAYLAVYMSKNLLSAASPQMIAAGDFSTEQIGTLSAVYYAVYAVGQLINGIVGDRIKAKYMITVGLGMAGVCFFLVPFMADWPIAAYIAYGTAGFFLAMIYGPLTKVVAENTESVYTTRCSLGYTFSSFFGSPIAGVLAASMPWDGAFCAGAAVLVAMSAVCFGVFWMFEKQGIIQYGKYVPAQKNGVVGSIRVLIKHRIIRFTLIAIITGVVRTTVVFWLPTYIAQYLGFAPETAAWLFTVATFIFSISSFAAVFLYEWLRSNMDRTILVFFCSAAVSFLVVYLVKQPAVNIAFMVLAILSADCAATILWVRYCPGLRDTGMVSGATGFLDACSYAAASASSTLFANAVSTIGWKWLIFVWFLLMVAGVATIILPAPWKGRSTNAQRGM